MNDERKTKKQLLEDLERERERSFALQEVSKRVAAAHDTDEVMDLIVNEAARLLGASAAYIRLLEGDSLVPRAATRSAADLVAGLGDLAVGDGLMGRVMATQKPLITDDVGENESAHPEDRLRFKQYGFHGAALVPLLANDHSIGVLGVMDRRIRRFNEDEVSLLAAFANQASLALEKARLLNDAETERERADSLYRVSNLLAGAHDTDEVLDLIVNEAARLVDAPAAFMRLLKDDVLMPGATTESAAGYFRDGAAYQPTVSVDAGSSFMGTVMASKKPVIIEDLQTDESISPTGRARAQKHGFHGSAAVPMLAYDRAVGVLSVADKRVRRFSEDEVSLLMAFADQASLALEKARLLNDAEREKERSDALYRVSNLLAGAHNTDEVLDLIVNEATQLVGAKAGFIRLLEGSVGVPAAATASAAGYLAETESTTASNVEDHETVAGRVMGEMKPVVVDDATKIENAPARNRALLKKYGLYGIASIPLVINGQGIGLLAVFDGNVRLFNHDEVSLLTAFADQASLALEKARLLNEAEREKERSDSLYRVSNLLAGAHDTDEVLDLIVNEAARLVGAAASWMRLFEGEVLVPGAATESASAFLDELAELRPSVAVGEDGSLLGRVMATKTPFVGDVLEERLIQPTMEPVFEKYGWNEMAAIPLLANDQPIGVLIVADARFRSFTDDEVSLLTAFADQAALALEKARLLNEAERERERSDALYRVSNLLAGAHDTEEVLELIVNEAARLVGASGAILRLLEGGSLVQSVATSSAAGFVADAAEIIPNLALAQGENPAGHVLATVEPLVLEDIEDSELASPEMMRIWRKHGLRGAALVPLIANDRSIGVLTLFDKRKRLFTEDEISLLTAFADQASLALEKARLLNEAEARERQATQLYEVTTQLASNHDLESVLDLITEQAAELMGGRSGAIFRYDEDRGGLVITTMYNLNPDMKNLMIKPGEGNAGRAYLERRVVWDDDVMGHYPFTDQESRRVAQAQTADWGAVGVLAAPILIQDEVYGVLDVIFDRRRQFTDEEIKLIQNLADSAAVAINNARFIQETEQARDEATQLYEITEQLASSQDMDSVLDLITAKSVELLECEGSSILEYDAVRDGLTIARTHNFPSESEGIFYSSEDSISGRAFQSRKPVWTKDRNSEPSIAVATAVNIRGLLSVPVVVRDEPYGVLNVFYLEPHEFTDAEIQLLQTLADSAAVAIGNARFIEEIQQRTSELAATNQELEAFSYSVSHDLRAPLRGIDGFSQALMNEYSDVMDEQANHYLERVRTGSQRMGQLIDDLLALSQVTRGEMRRENVDLSNLAKTIATGLQESDPQREVEFVIQDGVAVNGDTRLMRVALENLLGNAWKYTGKKEKARIEFGLTEDDGKRVCFVRDDGSGFDMAYADRLFGAFQRLHDASEFEGSGIGLATVQRIINRHGGQIWAEAAVGEGATFYFTLHPGDSQHA